MFLSRSLKRIVSSFALWTTSPEDAYGEMRSHLTELETWWSNVPSYFKTETSTPPSYARALYYLHLRYLQVTTIVTRFSLLPHKNAPCNLVVRDHLNAACQAANQLSLHLLHMMRQKGLISTRNFQDVHHILAVGIVLVVRNVFHPCKTHMLDLKEMQSLYQLTDHAAIGRAGSRAVSRFITQSESFQHSERYASLLVCTACDRFQDFFTSLHVY